jgi:hypothetical protein
VGGDTGISWRGTEIPGRDTRKSGTWGSIEDTECSKEYTERF